MKDMMPHFDLFQPDTLDAALDLRRASVRRLGADRGGQDSYDWLKNRQAHRRGDRHQRHRALKGIRETGGGLRSAR